MTKLKVVVRRLPPNLPEPIFWDSVAQWVSTDSVTWKSFHPGKPRSRPEKPNVPSRAYIMFKAIEQVSRFSREYDGHIFRDKQGNESFAIVEFAPFQKVPQERKKQDTRMATIQQDDDFRSFLESLHAAPPSVSEPAVPTIDPKATPLLVALKAEKSAAKDAAQILSYHGHYHKAAKADRAASKVPKAAAAAGIVKEDEAVVFSRKLNPDGTPAVVPKAILTNSEGSSKALGKSRGNGTEASPHAPPKQPEKAKKKILQSQAQSQGKGPCPPDTTSVTILPHPSPKPTPASKTGLSTPSTAAELAEAVASQGGSSARPERKRHVVNPRMFEAAVASMGGGVRRREKEAKKEKDDATGGETSQVGAASAPAPTTSSSAAHTSKPADVSASTSDRQTNPPIRGGGHGVGKNPKRDRGSKHSGPPKPETGGAGNGSVAAAPKIIREAKANVQPATTSVQPENGTADIKDAGGPGVPASRGSHSGRRGRGRGRGRGGASSGAGLNTSSTDS